MCIFRRETSPSTLTERMDFLGGEAYGEKEPCNAADGHGLQSHGWSMDNIAAVHSHGGIRIGDMIPKRV